MTAPTRIQVLLEEEIAHRFKQYCDENGHKKSTLIARLVKDFLDQQNYPMQSNLPFAKENDSK